MNHKIITSNGDIYDVFIELKSLVNQLNPTVSSKEFLDFVNNNYENIIMNSEIKNIYNTLWSGEEQFTSKVLKTLNNNFK